MGKTGCVLGAGEDENGCRQGQTDAKSRCLNQCEHHNHTTHVKRKPAETQCFCRFCGRGRRTRTLGTRFLEPWLNIVREGYEVHYIVLRANKEETMKRAIERSKLDRKTNIELVEIMWEQFNNLGAYEKNILDTTQLSVEDTVSAIKEKVANKATLLLESL